MYKQAVESWEAPEQLGFATFWIITKKKCPTRSCKHTINGALTFRSGSLLNKSGQLVFLLVLLLCSGLATRSHPLKFTECARTNFLPSTVLVTVVSA